MQLAEELILKKRDGLQLSAEEITTFIQGVSTGSVSDAQIAAFTMATWFRGMVPEEQMALTLAMRDSGKVLEWDGLDGPVLDKHSTGGVGDMVSLLLGPIVAACGGYVPMISGRGLGHTGGTLDKLESIPGFDSGPDIEKFQRLVREQHIAIIGQTGDLAPADRRIYAVRDVTATVASTPLIVSSILSKKLAEGLDALVMDIKCGSGAFTPDHADALSLAGEICAVASEAGLPCNALVTDMDQPLAGSAGNALEVAEAVRFLRGDERHVRLHSVVVALSCELLQLGGLADGPAKAAAMVGEALDTGRAAESFSRMVAAQGGPPDLLQSPERILPAAPLIRPVYPDEAGFVTRIGTRRVGQCVIVLGGGRQRAEDQIDPSVGLSQIAGVGVEVGPQQPLAVIHAPSEDSWKHAAHVLRSGFTIGPERLDPGPAVHAAVQGGVPHARH